MKLHAPRPAVRSRNRALRPSCAALDPRAARSASSTGATRADYGAKAPVSSRLGKSEPPGLTLAPASSFIDSSVNKATLSLVAGRPRSFDEDQVLDRAMMLFWAKGYEATGIVELEQATGLGRQSLYGAFGDKRALFLRIVERYFERVLKPHIVDVLDAPGSGRANIERIFAQWESVATAADFHGCLVGNSVPEFGSKDSQMSAVLGRKLELMEAAFNRALRRAKQSGEVNPDLDTRATARSLLTIAQGLAVVARVNREPAFVRGVLHTARRMLD